VERASPRARCRARARRSRAGEGLLDRPLEGDWPYVWPEPTYVKVRRNHRIVFIAVIVAVGVNADGRRQVLGMDIGPPDVLAYMDFPPDRWPKLYAPYGLDGGIKRGTEVVGIFPNDDAIVRLVGAPSWSRTTNGPSSASDTRPWKPSQP
jgi:transposase-like protein